MFIILLLNSSIFLGGDIFVPVEFAWHIYFELGHSLELQGRLQTIVLRVLVHVLLVGVPVVLEEGLRSYYVHCTCKRCVVNVGIHDAIFFWGSLGDLRIVSKLYLFELNQLMRLLLLGGHELFLLLWG